MSIFNNLKEKIKSKKVVIGIIGLGYVGLPLVIRYANAGFNVIGFDVDSKKIEKLNQGQSYIEHIPSKKIKDILGEKFSSTVDMSRISDADALIICVPTPLNHHREPDLSYVINTIESLLPFLRPGHIISLESTTYPGTTEEELLPRISSCGFTVGENIFLLYSPEREDPGNKLFNTQNIPKVVGGHTSNCLELGKDLYGQAIDKIVPVSSTKAAELTKLLENIHRAVNIGLVNEMKIIADCMGIDIHEVIRAASTKPFGFTPYYPGPGLGGHCIPVDPFYLTWKAREYHINTRFIELAGEVNASMPRWIVQKTMDSLNSKSKALMGSKILILGLSYKKNIDDIRESPAIELINLFLDKGAYVEYSDPHVPNAMSLGRHEIDMQSIKLDQNSIKNYDVLVLVTNHDAFDYELILNNANLIIDTRGVYLNQKKNVVRA
jgi:UDP-N-acetyl-D-glucosamine dehydrogenase